MNLILVQCWFSCRRISSAPLYPVALASSSRTQVQSLYWAHTRHCIGQLNTCDGWQTSTSSARALSTPKMPILPPTYLNPIDSGFIVQVLGLPRVLPELRCCWPGKAGWPAPGEEYMKTEHINPDHAEFLSSQRMFVKRYLHAQKLELRATRPESAKSWLCDGG